MSVYLIYVYFDATFTKEEGFYSTNGKI